MSFLLFTKISIEGGGIYLIINNLPLCYLDFMEIVKIFSEVDTEEKLYSVLLDEDEALLFSEFQKEFARKDYEGLTDEAAEYLRKKRGDLAKRLNLSRKISNREFFRDALDKRNILHESDLNYFNRIKEDLNGDAFMFDTRVRESKESIAKHQKVADALRKKKELAKKIKVGSGIAAGTLAVAGTAYGVKKYRDSK